MNHNKLRLCWLLCLLLVSITSHAAPSCNWPEWEHFSRHFINQDGRVIDPDGAKTTSEGQAYGLMFALIANQPEQFALILRWTQDNLAAGDLSAHLPAWLWGKQKNDAWGIIDQNSAADADLWIVYALLEAGRLWQNTQYQALASTIAERMLREETQQLPKLGTVLLPGAYGFINEAGVTRLNPSYLPIQVLRRLAVIDPKSNWKAILSSALETLVRASPKGFAPDWISYQDGALVPDQQSHALGSYDAIRVYLWAGMLSRKEPAYALLQDKFQAMVQYVISQGQPPLSVDTRLGQAQGEGPAGFSAALLPILKDHPKAQQLQRTRINATASLSRTDNYYDQVLSLFGIGWLDGRYQFSHDGKLVTNWTCKKH